MELRTAASWARQEMDKHGLTDWRFVWDDAQSRFGACHWYRKEISLSKALVKMNSEDEVLDTIRHEVAHAIAGHEAGHDWKWRQACALTGARPERTYSQKKVATPPMKWTGTCPGCGKKIHRRTLFKEARGMSCGTCSGDVWNAAYVFVWKENR